MPLYENGVCLGDSLTVGARTPAGLAEELAIYLNSLSDKRWLFRCEAENGDTVVQLLRRMDRRPWMWRDASFATLLIGTNDAKTGVETPPELFQQLYGQILDRLTIARLLVFPALLPSLQLDARLASPYDAGCNERIAKFNKGIQSECGRLGLERWIIDLTDLPKGSWVDGVHFSTAGVKELAIRFADRIIHR